MFCTVLCTQLELTNDMWRIMAQLKRNKETLRKAASRDYKELVHIKTHSCNKIKKWDKNKKLQHKHDLIIKTSNDVKLIPLSSQSPGSDRTKLNSSGEQMILYHHK